METVTINMNVQSKVTLTKAGADIINKYYKNIFSDHSDYIKKFNLKIYKEGDIFESVFWELFEIFGPSIHMAMLEVPFKDNVIILNKTI